jgi:hypothetical protein
MNIKEVFEKCNDGDYVVDNKNIKWKVIGGELTNIRFNLYNLYTLKQLLDLDFKKFYNVDWSKVEVDTKILVSFDNEKWYKRYFAKFEDGKIYTFANGTTSFSYNYRELVPWKYAKLYKEGNDYVSL